MIPEPEPPHKSTGHLTAGKTKVGAEVDDDRIRLRDVPVLLGAAPIAVRPPLIKPDLNLM